MNGFLSKTSFQLKKHSPEILVVAGVIGVVTSAVMACKATVSYTHLTAGSFNYCLYLWSECIKSKETGFFDECIRYAQ